MFLSGTSCSWFNWLLFIDGCSIKFLPSLILVVWCAPLHGPCVTLNVTRIKLPATADLTTNFSIAAISFLSLAKFHHLGGLVTSRGATVALAFISAAFLNFCNYKKFLT